MTPLFFLAHGVLALLIAACARAGASTRDRVVRAAGWMGVAMGIATVVLRFDLTPWRSTAIEPGTAAIAGASVACAWGLTLALDLGADRWWIAAVAGIGSSGLLLFAGALWTVPALLFWLVGSAALALATARSDRFSWLLLAASDVAVVAVLFGPAGRGSWLLPTTIAPALLIPLGIAIVLRTGVLPFVGPTAVIATHGAALVPLWVGSGFVLLVRFVHEPVGIPAAGALAVALGIVAFSTVRRRLHPGIVGSWPIALGVGLCLASERAAEPAAVGAVLSVSSVVLWPEALGRGRLARAFVLSAGLPNVAFAALATAAADSFARVTAPGDALETAAWVTTSGLLPIALGSGVALGAVSLRSGTGQGYHPEATFMTWLLLGASVVAGVVLGAGGVYEALGGGGAVALFTAALAAGGFAALRTRTASGETMIATAEFVLDRPSHGPWPPHAAMLGLHALAMAAISWLTIEGLRVGFL